MCRMKGIPQPTTRAPTTVLPPFLLPSAPGPALVSSIHPCPHTRNSPSCLISGLWYKLSPLLRISSPCPPLPELLFPKTQLKHLLGSISWRSLPTHSSIRVNHFQAMAWITQYHNCHIIWFRQESPAPEFYSFLYPWEQTLPGDIQICDHRKTGLPCMSGSLTRLFPEGWKTILPIFLTSQLITMPGTYGCAVYICGIVFNMIGEKKQKQKKSNPSVQGI